MEAVDGLTKILHAWRDEVVYWDLRNAPEHIVEAFKQQFDEDLLQDGPDSWEDLMSMLSIFDFFIEEDDQKYHVRGSDFFLWWPSFLGPLVGETP